MASGKASALSFLLLEALGAHIILLGPMVATVAIEIGSGLLLPSPRERPLSLRLKIYLLIFMCLESIPYSIVLALNASKPTCLPEVKKDVLAFAAFCLLPAKIYRIRPRITASVADLVFLTGFYVMASFDRRREFQLLQDIILLVTYLLQSRFSLIVSFILHDVQSAAGETRIK